MEEIERGAKRYTMRGRDTHREREKKYTHTYTKGKLRDPAR